MSENHSVAKSSVLQSSDKSDGKENVKRDEALTKEEAIAELKYARAMCEFDPVTGEVGFRNDEDRRQAASFDMAIKELEHEPCEGMLKINIQSGVLNQEITKGWLERHGYPMQVYVDKENNSVLIHTANEDDSTVECISIEIKENAEMFLPLGTEQIARGETQIPQIDYIGNFAQRMMQGEKGNEILVLHSDDFWLEAADVIDFIGVSIWRHIGKE